ncbi:MAG: adenine phosphoribosyltransferase [Alphaproteobacteria bacterium]|nr:adenine phosphoribosyltransferase [Alphaproteobacteria bacterium]MDA7983439.1 adenine phosphoribosyltransferase [Alphaproteobacteria bacterium]MDA7988992.1 adenine phosphoribosyltransferase [Alphaproteobacteria bacterium]MDA8009490.1 adenine phosphoribosyltransferase [Alphaproteobacteria bacterium]MDA8031847.1 adenine phosphoribosyltransferase [Alphaproteobacteria bacterium]
MRLRGYIAEVPDFPREGILFYDISPLLADAGAWRAALDELEAVLTGVKPTLLVGIESRGFLLAAPLADRLGAGFIMARKAGKLPGATDGRAYDLEYGQERLELQSGAVKSGDRVALIDDLIATGGTARAAVLLLRGLGAEVACVACLLELTELGGRAALEDISAPLHSLIPI